MDDRQVLSELVSRKEARKKFVLSDYLFDKQLQFVLDPSPFKAAVTTRRAGKSTSCVADLTDTALNTPDCVCLYITLSRKNAKRLVWPEFKKLNKRFKLGGKVNESDLSITFENGSVIYLLGAKDRSAIEDFRGLPIKKVYLDEAQSFPAYIKDLIDDVIGPALMDYAGTLCLIGTPGPIPAGYFFELTKNKEWSHHFWSFFDNPFIPQKSGKTHQEILDRELKRRGVTADDPSIQREWFGKWVVDKNALVFQYSDSLNHYDTLPVLPKGQHWTYVLGIDLGFDDADALAVIAYNETSTKTYLLDELVTPHQDVTALCAQIDKLQKRYEFSKIVIDSAGLGKKITEEINRRYKISMVPAEKARKLEYIELLNDALRTANFMVKSRSLFAQDTNKVEWDRDKSKPDKKVISDRFHSDICDAVLYAWRESYSYLHEKPTAGPKPGTPEFFKQEEDKMYDHEFERHKELEGAEDVQDQPLDWKFGDDE